MLPGFVTQPAGSPAETPGAVAASAVNGGPVQPGDATSTSAPDEAGFDTALTSACDAGAPATPGSAATRSAKANAAAVPQEKPSAATESAFAIWRLVMGLGTADAAGTTAQAEGKPAQSDDDEEAATTGQPVIAMADASCLPQPVMVDAIPSPTITTIETDPDPSADGDSATEASGAFAASNTIGTTNLAGTGQPASDDPPLVGRVFRPDGESGSAATSETAPVKEQLPAGASDWRDDDAASAAAVTSAGTKDTSTRSSPEPGRSDERPAGQGLSAPASANVMNEGAASTARQAGDAEASTGSPNDTGLTSNTPRGVTQTSGGVGTATAMAAGPSAPATGHPSLAAGAATVTVAASDVAPAAVDTAPSPVSPTDVATLGMQSAVPALESRLATSGSAHGETKAAALEAAAAAAAVNGAPATAAGSRDSSSRDNSEARGRAGAQEMPFVTRTATAFSTALTLVAFPDGTLRLASGVSAAAVLAPLLPEQATANIDQMVQSMRVMVKDSISEATVHLRPEHFGDVRIQVRVDGKNVSAIVHTDSAGVHEWLNGQEATLRSGLAEHGLHLDRLIVQRDGRQDRRQAAQQQPEPRRRRVRPDADPNQTFEVSV